MAASYSNYGGRIANSYQRFSNIPNNQMPGDRLSAIRIYRPDLLGGLKVLNDLFASGTDALYDQVLVSFNNGSFPVCFDRVYFSTLTAQCSSMEEAMYRRAIGCHETKAKMGQPSDTAARICRYLAAVSPSLYLKLKNELEKSNLYIDETNRSRLLKAEQLYNETLEFYRSNPEYHHYFSSDSQEHMKQLLPQQHSASSYVGSKACQLDTHLAPPKSYGPSLKEKTTTDEKLKVGSSHKSESSNSTNVMSSSSVTKKENSLEVKYKSLVEEHCGTEEGMKAVMNFKLEGVKEQFDSENMSGFSRVEQLQSYILWMKNFSGIEDGWKQVCKGLKLEATPKVDDKASSKSDLTSASSKPAGSSTSSPSLPKPQPSKAYTWQQYQKAVMGCWSTIEGSIDPNELHPHLSAKDFYDGTKAAAIVADFLKSADEKLAQILSVMEQYPERYELFCRALKDEKEHSGHDYILKEINQGLKKIALSS